MHEVCYLKIKFLVFTNSVKNHQIFERKVLLMFDKSFGRVFIEVGAMCGILISFALWICPNSWLALIFAGIVGIPLAIFLDDPARRANAIAEALFGVAEYLYTPITVDGAQRTKEFKIWWAHYVANFLFLSCGSVPVILITSLNVRPGKEMGALVIVAFLLAVWITASCVLDKPSGYRDWVPPRQQARYDEELKKYNDETEIQKKLNDARRWNFFGLFIHLPLLFVKNMPAIVKWCVDWTMWTYDTVVYFFRFYHHESYTVYIVDMFLGTVVLGYLLQNPALGFLYGGLIGVLDYKIISVRILEMDKVKEKSAEEARKKKEEEAKRLPAEPPRENDGLGGYW